MSLTMKIFITIACLLYVSAKPFADEHPCKVNEVYHCGYEPCVCKNEAAQKGLWVRAVGSFLSAKKKRCQCSKFCSRVVEAPCEKGVCNKASGRCQCFPCWTGAFCSIYANKHAPKFLTSYTEIKIKQHLNQSNVVGRVTASDDDELICKPGLDCPCGNIEYHVTDGADDTFDVNAQTGEIVLRSPPYKDDYLLEIDAKNKEIAEYGNEELSIENKHAKQLVHIDTTGYIGERIIIHRRERRSVSSGTLVLTVAPASPSKIYYDIGDTIVFTVSLSHNSSVTAVDVSNVVIGLTSEFLTLTTAGLQKTKTGSFTPQESLANNELTLSLTGASFTSGNSYSANVTTTVKNTIGPLSNLLLTAKLNATTNVYIEKKSNPVLYAKYPNVNLTASSTEAVRVYGTKNYTMRIQFPKLNYSLLAELTTNIEDFIFMEIANVQVKNKGVNVHYNGTATPTYHSSLSNGKHDRVVIDFGYLRNNADTGNTIDITFTVKVFDHSLLANNTKHWIGVGLQAGFRVLWVEQQSFYIIKEEPTLAVSLNSVGVSNVTRLFIGDELTLSYSVNHTNTSTANAVKVKILCTFEYLVAVSGASFTTVNSTSVIVKVGGNDENSLSLGGVSSGTFKLKVPEEITPFVSATVKLTVSYENFNGNKKTPLTATIPGVLIGTPTILMSLDYPNNTMMPGEIRTFSVSVKLTKLRSPIRFELVMPTVANMSIFHIVSVDKAVIGSNINGLNANAQPILKSTNNDNITNVAIYDLGIGKNTNSSTASTAENTIVVKFKVLLNDHQNVTNGSSYWVGAGLVAKPKMIWVGQLTIIASIPANSRPILSMNASIIPGVSGSKTYPDYRYSVYIAHKSLSRQFAYDVKIRFFLPEYIEYKSLDMALPRVTNNMLGASRLFKIKNPDMFLDTFNITFKVSVLPDKLPHTGKVYITTPIYVLYKNRIGQQFTLIKALKTSIDVPIKPLPTVTPVAEYYEKGFSWHETGAGSYLIYFCSDVKIKTYKSACFVTEDKGITWKAVDSRVASINGHDASGDSYGIASDKLTYLKFDKGLKNWVSIPKASFNPTAGKTVKLSSSDPNGDPSVTKTVSSDGWGVSKDGLFYKAGGTGGWDKKANWF